MPNFRAKPVMVDAIQYTGANFHEIEKFTNGEAYKMGGKSDMISLETFQASTIYITTGCWIIKQINGQYYSLDNETFINCYEKVFI